MTIAFATPPFPQRVVGEAGFEPASPYERWFQFVYACAVRARFDNGQAGGICTRTSGMARRHAGCSRYDLWSAHQVTILDLLFFRQARRPSTLQAVLEPEPGIAPGSPLYQSGALLIELHRHWCPRPDSHREPARCGRAALLLRHAGLENSTTYWVDLLSIVHRRTGRATGTRTLHCGV
jgi:hypothetical protein